MNKNAGALFCMAGITILMGIVTAEIFYPPGYSISQSMISNLAATRPPHSITVEPSATIFNISMILSGILILAGAYFIQVSFQKSRVTISIILMGVGLVGVGLFPAFHAVIHPLLALLTFLAGGIAAIVSSHVTTMPFRLIALILGVVTLFFLFLGILDSHLIVPLLGDGGTERWVAYPIILWLVSFGGYLMAVKK